MTPASILVADDDRGIRTVLNQALGRAGYDVRSTGNASTLWRWVSDGAGDLVITDVVMPDESGLDLLPRVKKLRPDLPVVVMSARNTLLTAVKATERGAYEYLPKSLAYMPPWSELRSRIEAAGFSDVERKVFVGAHLITATRGG